MTTELPSIIVTSADYERLFEVLSTVPDSHPVASFLAGELDRAEIVEPEEVPADVVTMNSRLLIEEVGSGEQHDVTLVYPTAANFETGRLSILAPVGAALLGLRTGQTIEWPLPSGKKKSVRVVQVNWQPEAAGELRM